MGIPEHIQKYFWDTDINKLNIKKYSKYIIERIMEFGDIKSVKWLFNIYPSDFIIINLKKGINLSRKSAIFWAHFLEIDEREIECLKK